MFLNSTTDMDCPFGNSSYSLIELAISLWLNINAFLNKLEFNLVRAGCLGILYISRTHGNKKIFVEIYCLLLDRKCDCFFVGIYF